jgi:hypothetical protein
MSAPASIPRFAATEPHAEFLSLYPIVSRHARIVFRGRSPADQEEATAEAVAAAFESYVRLKDRGMNPARDFPSALATFAALHVKGDRHVGGKISSTDVLSPNAQRRHGFRVESLSLSTRTSQKLLYGKVDGQQTQDAFEERLRDDTRTPIPDQVAFRIDFSTFRRAMKGRDRRMALALSVGESASSVARRFGMSGGRVSQLRQQWHRAWQALQCEAPRREIGLGRHSGPGLRKFPLDASHG